MRANSNIKRILKTEAIDQTEEPAAALIWRRSRPAAGLAATVDSKTANQTQYTNCQMPFKKQIVKVGK